MRYYRLCVERVNLVYYFKISGEGEPNSLVTQIQSEGKQEMINSQFTDVSIALKGL